SDVWADLRGARPEQKACLPRGAKLLRGRLLRHGGKTMTAEVAVMNKLAVALSGARAATVTTEGGQKGFYTANKLFTLSKFAPVGLLIYNSTQINGIPVEVIVKEFREQLRDKRYKHLDSYVERFWSFLESGPPITDASREQNLRRLLLFSFRDIYMRA